MKEGDSTGKVQGVNEAPPLGKYGRMRLRYLKEHRPCTYTALLLSGKLYDDLHDAEIRYNKLRKKKKT